MRPHWDANSPELAENLLRVARTLRDHAQQESRLSLLDIQNWHRDMLQGLAIPEAAELGFSEDAFRGHFRGPSELPGVLVGIGARQGVEPDRVAAQCRAFIQQLDELLTHLQALCPNPNDFASQPAAADEVLSTAAWAHAEWVRIHPFGNGNGRTARLIANWVLLHCGLPPLMRPRPRPEGSYAHVGQAAMEGDIEPTLHYLRNQLRNYRAA
jgi:Fic family protein